MIQKGFLAVRFHREVSDGRRLDVLLDVRLAVPIIVVLIDVVRCGDGFHLSRFDRVFFCA